YPKTWSDLTKSRRELAQRLERRKDPKTLEIEAKLNAPITLNIDNQPLGEVLDFLRQYTGLNIQPDGRALADEGLTLNTPITLKGLKDIKLKNALKIMLRDLHLTYDVRDEVLMITSPTTNRAQLVTQAYDVADLVIPIPKPDPNAMPTPSGALPLAATPQ